MKDTFDIKKFLVENKLTNGSRKIEEISGALASRAAEKAKAAGDQHGMAHDHIGTSLKYRQADRFANYIDPSIAKKAKDMGFNMEMIGPNTIMISNHFDGKMLAFYIDKKDGAASFNSHRSDVDSVNNIDSNILRKVKRIADLVRSSYSQEGTVQEAEDDEYRKRLKARAGEAKKFMRTPHKNDDESWEEYENRYKKLTGSLSRGSKEMNARLQAINAMREDCGVQEAEHDDTNKRKGWKHMTDKLPGESYEEYEKRFKEMEKLGWHKGRGGKFGQNRVYGTSWSRGD